MPIEHSALEEAKNAIRDAQTILIVPHANVDPDGLSAALACHLFFSSLGKSCTVVCPDTPAESLEFLPGFQAVERELKATQDYVITLDCSRGFKVEKLQHTIEDRAVNIIVTGKGGALTESDISFREGPPPFDLIVVVDTADLPLLGSLYERHRALFEKVPVLNVDHHVSNTRFGNLQLINAEAASATEVLYDWFSSFDSSSQAGITPDIATLLLTGLITDTRSFQNPNTTPRSLEVASELLERGARQQEIIRSIYKTKSLSTLKIWGRVLRNIQTDPGARIIWSAVGMDDLRAMGAASKETHGIIDELLTTIPDADIYILFTEVEEGGLKASMRSRESVDASALAAKLFGGGGHARAAGFRVRDYDNFQLKVLECVQRIVEEMKGERGKIGQAEETKEAKGADDGTIDILKKLADG